MTVLDLRPLGFGEILDGAFSLYRRHFLVMFVSTLIPVIPLWYIGETLTAAAATDPEMTGGALGPAVLLFIFGPIGLTFLWAALTRQYSQAVVGSEVSLPDGYAQGARAMLPVLGAGIIAVFILIPLFVLALLAGALITLTLGAAGEAGALLGGFVGTVLAMGVVLLVVTALFAVVPAVVVERQGPWAALRRSWELSRGARLRILGVLIVAWLITMLPMLGLIFIAGTGAAMIDPAAADGLSRTQLLIQQVGGLLVGALTTPFYAGAMVLLYFDRRVRTEAYDLELATASLPHGS